jgi:hypothetical protein
MNRGNQSNGNLDLDQIENKIDELTAEWDIERILELTAIGVSLLGIMLASSKSKKLLYISGAVATLLGAKSLQEWQPPVPFLEHLGFRHRDEIRQEIDELKGSRGGEREKRNKRVEAAEA